MIGKKILPEDEIKIYNLRKDEGLTYKQIATRFNLNISHIGPVIRRVQQRKDNQKHDYS